MKEAREMQNILTEKEPAEWPMDELRVLGYVAGYILREFLASGAW